ncbi:MAG TPA: lipocalin family protein [Salinarimonas sp.]|jgi:apolipoprotein D and lipocalin family protein|nr:lipocalin family protein [Salinarimonas sp.]
MSVRARLRPVALALGLPLALAAGGAAAQTTPGTEVMAPQTLDFDVERILGTWHEIARLDHPFERGLIRVTSTRARQPDGTIAIVNRGVDKASGQTRESKATARLLESAGRPAMEIDYGAAGGKHTYDVLQVAPDGSHLLIGATDRSALWILARQPVLDSFVVDQLKARALSAGFSLDGLIMVEQGR